MYQNSIVVSIRQGIHLRIAAEIVRKAEQLTQKFGIKLYIRKLDNPKPIEISGLGLLALKIKQDDVIEIISMEETFEGMNAVIELCDFIYNLMGDVNTDLTQVDSIIEHTKLANEQIIENLPIGIVVVDINASVIIINEYGLKLTEKNAEEVRGLNIKSVLPSSVLTEALFEVQRKSGIIQHYNDKILISNISTISTDNRIIGAVEVFQDISELEGMKELNEKFKTIINTSGDLISFIDENRKISYLNPAYLTYFPKHSESILKDLAEISPEGLRMKAFITKEKFENVVNRKETVDVISTVEPLYIDGKFKGIISISKPVNHIKSLLKKLEESEERLNYYKEELLRQKMLSQSFGDIVGSSSSLKDCLVIAERASKSTSTVLIRGESGTGKELIAKAIHNNSNRKDKSFVRVNCAAIPENLIESELFGHEKGAFTGALNNKQGKFAIANGGTIFLDEIGDMPRHMQVKLLRVLQEREFESVGGLTTHKIDVRVLAATNRNLEEMMKTGEFREDLYYRLNVMFILLPPLRNRIEDIPILSESFIEKFNKKLGKSVKGIDNETILYLQSYHWPGNIRELENIIERAMNMCDETILSKKDFPSYIIKNSQNEGALINLTNGELLLFEEYEKELIEKAMKIYKSYNKAGKALGLTHRTISLKCQKYGIKNLGLL
jgi:transcriptional regulator with PAS, ATPase and Fis domain